MSQRNDASGRPPARVTTAPDEPWGAQADATAQSCQAVQRSAGHAFRHCLALGGERAQLELVRLLVDAGEVCQLTAQLLARRSELAPRLAGLAAEVCQRAAEASAIHQDEVPLVACAEDCRAAAEACRTLSRDAALIDYDEIVEDSFPASDPPPGPGSRSRR